MENDSSNKILDITVSYEFGRQQRPSGISDPILSDSLEGVVLQKGLKKERLITEFFPDSLFQFSELCFPFPSYFRHCA